MDHWDGRALHSRGLPLLPSVSRAELAWKVRHLAAQPSDLPSLRAGGGSGALLGPSSGVSVASGASLPC